MKLTYIENFNKTSVDNMEAVQEAISKAGVPIDSKLLPLIDEAEKGDFGSMAELYEMFTFGDNNVKPSYEMSMRYWTKLHAINLASEDPIVISESLNNFGYLHYEFEKMEEATNGFMEAFRYMVSNLEPKEWDAQIVKLVAENIETYQNEDGTE